MHKILRLIRREYKASVMTKGFIIGLALAPLFTGGSFIVTMLFKDRVDTTDKRIAIVDRSGVIAEAVVKASEARNAGEIYDKETGKKVKPVYLFEVVDPSKDKPEVQRLELSDRIRAGKLYAFVEIGSNIIHPTGNQEASRIAYYSRNAAMDEIRRWIVWPINNQLRKLRLTDAGIDESDVKDLFVWANVDALGLVSADAETGKVKDAQRTSELESVGIPIIMMFMMFMMMMMGAIPLLGSVMEEKTQRIAEVLLGSIRPFEFMMGKVLGGVAVSLTASAVYVIGGIIVIRRMGFGEYIPYHILPWFFTYMVLTIIMLGSIFTALGASCSDPKDSASLTMPAMLPVLIPMFLIMPVIREPQGSIATWLSLFPFFTPFTMLLRQSTPGGVPLWQSCVGLLGILVFTVFFVWAGGRIFRVGILMQGTPPKLSNIIRWALRG